MIYEIDDAKKAELHDMYIMAKRKILTSAAEGVGRCPLCKNTGLVDIGYCKDGYHWQFPCECKKKQAAE